MRGHIGRDASACFHYSPRNNKEIVHEDNLIQGKLNDLPIRECLVTNFSLIYRFRETVPGEVPAGAEIARKSRFPRILQTLRSPAGRAFAAVGIKIPQKNSSVNGLLAHGRLFQCVTLSHCHIEINPKDGMLRAQKFPHWSETAICAPLPGIAAP
ncbi:TPA: hypothetical protein SAY52_004692 [Burkholderia cenocepacia]|uniref:hypothetical protein n=1 Tax=unclassified Burkholderia TaxID=2613784 RepID=UPI00158C9522|nr:MULTISPECIES: hypothetical protein [unclassified Burkholderia]HEF5874025.1 hypothetical protein [Burkholderia cenocepacia]